MRDVEIGVVYDANGKCTHLSHVKMVNKQELNKLTNEKNEIEQKNKANAEKYKNQLDAFQTKTDDRLYALENKIFIVAKSIYDNFVDRGLIENDDAFQQMWFDFYFNDGELNLELAPQEYKTILAKVGN